MTKILTNGNTAYGVQLTRTVDGTPVSFNLTASKEIIVSAGAINTPQLLLLSGIGKIPILFSFISDLSLITINYYYEPGPAKQLDYFNIPMVVDSPGVGNNLQDHCLTFLSFGIRNGNPISRESQLAQEDALYAYAQYAKGPLSGIQPLLDLAVFMNTQKLNNPALTIPDIECHFFHWPAGGMSLTLFFDVIGLKEPLKSALIAENMNQEIAMPLIILLQPESFGDLRLQSVDPLVYPSINAAYYTDKNRKDITTQINAVKQLLPLVDTPAFRALNATVIDVKPPPCEQYGDFSNDAFIDCYCRYITLTVSNNIKLLRLIIVIKVNNNQNLYLFSTAVPPSRHRQNG